MALFERKVCSMCGEKAGMLTRQKIADGYICGDCRARCSSNLTWREFESMTSDNVYAHMAWVEQNEETFRREFRESYAINCGVMGGTHVMSVDELHGWWVPAGNTHDIIEANQVISYRLELETKRLSPDEIRNPRRTRMPMPPMGMPGCAPDEEITVMKVIVEVNHPWLRVIEMKVMNAVFVTEADIRAGYEAAQRIFMYFDQQRMRPMRPAAPARPVPPHAAQVPPRPVPPRPAPAGEDPAQELMKYKQLLDMGAITREEYEIKKRQLLGL